MDKNCINCECFCWWDGDYCCTWRMKILCHSPKGEMNEDILTSIEKNKDCSDWRESDKCSIEEYTTIFNKFLKEYESKSKEN